MKSLFACFLIVVAAAFFGFSRQRTLHAIQTEIAELEASVETIRNLQREDRSLFEVNVNEERLRKLRERRRELMRLRDEASRLTAAERIQIPEIQAQIRQLSEQTESARAAGELAEARSMAKERSKAAKAVISRTHSAAFDIARQNNRHLPASIAQIQAYFQSSPREIPEYYSQVVVGSDLFGFSIRSVEVTARVPLDMPPDRAKASEVKPAHLYLREITPRELPDGGWSRCYLYSDGTVVEPFSSDGDFSDWERAHETRDVK